MAMYLIALCDDDVAELDKTEQLLGEYERRYTEADFKVERFECAEGLLGMVRQKGYQPDLIIMDIYMPDKMGIEAAQELRDMGNMCRILFLTSSREHALDAFSVGAVQYLVKPVSQAKLFPVLERFFEEAEEARRKYLLLRIDGRIQRVAVSDIVFCEAQGKMQCLYFPDGRQRVVRITMAEICGMLLQYPEFIRVGISYVINMEHIENFSRQEIQMDNGKKIYPPRGAYQPLRERYFAYYCEE